MADIKINGNTYTGVTKFYAQKSDGSGTAVFGTPTLQSKSATPSTSSQTISPDSGYDGLTSVSISAIQTQTKTATANGTVTPTSGYYLTSVTVAVPTYDGSVT